MTHQKALQNPVSHACNFVMASQRGNIRTAVHSVCLCCLCSLLFSWGKQLKVELEYHNKTQFYDDKKPKQITEFQRTTGTATLCVNMLGTSVAKPSQRVSPQLFHL